jgi:hypothetical protein
MTSTPNGPSGSISENDDAVRNLKSSESVVAAFHAEGFPSPPGDIAAIITAHVKSSTRDIPLNKIANMTPGSGPLGTSAAAGVNMFMNSLTPAQREAIKAGVNPLDATAMMKLGGLFKSDAGNFGRLSGRDATDGSGARFDGLALHGLTQNQVQARDLAAKLGLGWATNNPDLLRLGPSAIQALADVHLRQDSYERFKNGGLSAKTIVAGARYAKKHDIDYNEASKAYEDVHKSVSPSDQKVHSDAVTKFNESAGQPNAKPADEETAKKEFNNSMEKLKERNPAAREKIERQQRLLKTVQQQEHAAVKKADAKEAKNDDLAAKGADLLKKRQAAAQSPKPST